MSQQFPPGFGARPVQPHRQPVRAMGKADPASMRPQSVLDALFGHSQVEEFGRLLANAEALEDAPPWAIEILNTHRRLHQEVATLNYVLIRRGLITPEEINEGRMVIAKELDEQFRKVAENLRRGFNQAPGGQPQQPPSNDPRSNGK